MNTTKFMFRTTRCGSFSASTIRLTRLIYQRNYTSSTDTSNKYGGPWNLTKRWEISLPIGIGISLIAILQWRHLQRHPYHTEPTVKKGPISGLIVECYRCLPLRITSRIFGWLASIELPKSFRPFLYNLYASTFHANLDEIDCDLSSFPSLADFFVRPLKNDVRPIAPHSDLVSPVDGTVLHFGPVTSCRVEQVKGITYDLRNFLGDVKTLSIKTKTEYTSEENNNYLHSLLKNPDNHLYQLTIYLAPGDYHRFHSPTDWKIHFRKHFQGKLLSVNPKVASWLPDLFAINERVVYLGEWIGGFMAYAAVGATNVGSIKVYCDKNLATNKKKWRKGKISDDAHLEYINFNKGELFGEFRMGSTVVVLFEAPKNLEIFISPGQKVKVGEALIKNQIDPDKRKKPINLDASAIDAIELMKSSTRR